MKKLLPIALAVCLLLSACSGGSAKAYDPAGATQALADSGAFSVSMEELDAAVLYDFSGYGLDAGTLTDSKALSASGFAEQVSVTVWKSDADAKAAVAAFGTYLEDMKETYKNYAPAEVGKLDNAIVKQSGNSVILIVPADADAAKAAVDRLG